MVRFVETEETRMVAVRGWERRARKLLSVGHICYQECVKKLREMDSGDGCTTLWMYVMPLN